MLALSLDMLAWIPPFFSPIHCTTEDAIFIRQVNVVSVSQHPTNPLRAHTQIVHPLGAERDRETADLRPENR
jgi:hypothetical protein